MARKALGKTRVIISLAPDVLKRLDSLAKDNHQTRVGIVEDAVIRHLEREEKKATK